MLCGFFRQLARQCWVFLFWGTRDAANLSEASTETLTARCGAPPPEHRCTGVFVVLINKATLPSGPPPPAFQFLHIVRTDSFLVLSHCFLASLWKKKVTWHHDVLLCYRAAALKLWKSEFLQSSQPLFFFYNTPREQRHFLICRRDLLYREKEK